VIPFVAVTLGLLVQAAGNPLPARASRAPDPVRVWRVDSTVYVRLRERGHVVLLHVDAIGRIRVLFPLAPGDSTAISGEAPVAIPLPPVAEGNPATFVAVRSRWPFEFAALRAGLTWNYHDAFLLQPTAGDPLAALLEIADRVTDGRPYDYGVAAYSRDGTVATRRTPLQPTVCLSCVRHGETVAPAPAATTNTVDCSNASLTNSFCGIGNGSVSIKAAPELASQPEPATAPAPVYVPYYLPLVLHAGRGGFARSAFRFPEPAPAPRPHPSAAMAFPIAPRLVVPSEAELRSLHH